MAPYNPIQPVGPINLPPLSPGHLLGTDGIGRDLLSRTLIGIQVSWLSALVVVASGLLIGGTIGLIAGATGGWVDSVLLMRITDLFLALPGALVAIAIVAALGSGLVNTLIGVAIVWWPYYARIVRGEVKALAARPHVESARLAEVSRPRILLDHLLPGVIPTAVVSASLDIGNVVLLLAALSFLGLGQKAPAPELGADTARALSQLLSQWWVPGIPGHCGAGAEPDRQPRRRRHPQPHSGAEVGRCWRFSPAGPPRPCVILLTLSLVIFVLQAVSPGDPARAYVGANASPEMVAAERQRLGLNDPFFTRYFHFLGGLFTGDLGRSLRTRQPVISDIATYLPATAELVITAFLIALVLAALYALSGALRWPGAALGRGILLLLATAPPFLLALIGIIVFFGQLGWLPARGVGDFEDPGTVRHAGARHTAARSGRRVRQRAGAPGAPGGGVVHRACGGDRPGVQVVAAGRARRRLRPHRPFQGPDRGRRSWRITWCATRIGPALSMGGLQLGFMFAGVVVVEQVFSWPGIGNYLAASHPGRRLPGDRRASRSCSGRSTWCPTSSSTSCRRSPIRGWPPNELTQPSPVHRSEGAPPCTPDSRCARASPSVPRWPWP